MMSGRLSHVVGFDDAPFPRHHRGDVLVAGVVFAGQRCDGILATHVRRDGRNSTQRLIDCLSRSRFLPQVQVILLQGIAVAGFNVIDIGRLHRETGLGVVVVTRQAPDLPAIRRALLERVPGGRQKWRLIEAAGPMEAVGGVHVQRAGIDPTATAGLLTALQLHGRLPEPLRLAHMIAGGITTGESRHRA